MKTISFLILFAAMLLFAANSCSGNDDPEVGPEFTVSFDKTEFELSQAGTNITVKADKEAWGIGILRFFDEKGERRYDNEFFMEENEGNESQRFIREVSAEWVTAIQSDSNLELKVELQENKTGKDRKVIITLSGSVGYTSTDIEISQKSK